MLFKTGSHKHLISFIIFNLLGDEKNIPSVCYSRACSHKSNRKMGLYTNDCGNSTNSTYNFQKSYNKVKMEFIVLNNTAITHYNGRMTYEIWIQYINCGIANIWCNKYSNLFSLFNSIFANELLGILSENQYLTKGAYRKRIQSVNFAVVGAVCLWRNTDLFTVSTVWKYY